jgi:hypothetical protein
VQLAFTARLFGQLVVPGKSCGFAPESESELMVSEAVPELVMVTDCAAVWLFSGSVPKVNAVALSVTAGAPVETPVPESATDCGEPVPLSLSTIAALRDPVAVGLKVTVTVHEEPAARLCPQLVVEGKSPVFAPES